MCDNIDDCDDNSDEPDTCGTSVPLQYAHLSNTK